MSTFDFLPEKAKKEVELAIEECLHFARQLPLRAVVLGGGYKDKEVAYQDDQIISDLDIYFFSNYLPFFWRKVLRFEEKIDQKTNFKIDFHFALPLLLFKSRTYWAYRLKYQGIVLAGDKRILNKIRAEKDNLSKLEAFRILFFNLALWLTPEVNDYRIARSYLNLGEAILVYFQKLAPSFRERKAEFVQLSQELDLPKDLRDKIIYGYDVRLHLQSPEKKISLLEAKEDCFLIIEFLLKKMHTDNLLSLKVKPKIWLNVIFYFRLKKTNLKPKFFSLVFRFKITHLWQITAHFRQGNDEELTKLVRRFFYLDHLTEKTFRQIFQLYPLYSILEI